MKTVILAGGHGTRMSGYNSSEAKPMVTIGKIPILKHIMDIYRPFGHNDFVICMGKNQDKIVDWVRSNLENDYNITIETPSGKKPAKSKKSKSGGIVLVDTGENTMTGGRLKRVEHHLGERFMMTYGDGVANVDIGKLIAEHGSRGKLATVTLVEAEERYGSVETDVNGIVTDFVEKAKKTISGGFFVLQKKVLEMVEGDETAFEKDVMPLLAKIGELAAYRHHGFWHGMDTPADRDELNRIWNTGHAPWNLQKGQK